MLIFLGLDENHHRKIESSPVRDVDSLTSLQKRSTSIVKSIVRLGTGFKHQVKYLILFNWSGCS